jgi:hypothetical protein
MLIRFHSVVDVITNSSTTVYTWADKDADKRAKEILGDLMKVFGVTGEVDDYFDVQLVAGTRWLENHECYSSDKERGYSHMVDVDELDEDQLEAIKSVGALVDPENAEAYLLTEVQATALLATGKFSSDSYDSAQDTDLSVTAKHADVGDIASRFQALFSTSAVYE